jgi:malate dehydrogenase (oxaloacetate-decarboxylating)
MSDRVRADEDDKSPAAQRELRATAVRVSLRGAALLRTPLLNKGTGFTHEERRLFGIEGLLPYQHMNIEQQAARAYAQIEAQSTALQKYVSLLALEARNTHLFYRVLSDHIEAFMPIVYTPTVGQAVEQYSHVFQNGRGVWITPDMRGRMAQVLQAAVGGRRIRLLVVTDNEAILGLGDQGAGGMAISVGKLALYTAGARIHPAEVLPISLDFGTDNQVLLEDPLYLGWPERRMRGSAYDELVEEFVTAVLGACPDAVVQWEDFRKDNALRILDRYRDRLPSFNDDIQGTGAVVMAGVANALTIKAERLADQRIVVVGAGAAGLGIARQVRAELAEQGASATEQRRAVAVLDRGGLLIDDGTVRDAYKRELCWPAALAAEHRLDQASLNGRAADLAAVVEHYRPTILIGVSGKFGAFDEAVVRTMARHTDRPIIFPSSNPHSNSEAVPEDLIRWTEGRALVAAGSPYADVEYAGGRHRIGQGNNVFIFPGLGLATIATAARRVTDGMIAAASHALAGQVTPRERAEGLLFPSVQRLQEVSLAVARAVAQRAVADGAASIETRDIERCLEAAAWEARYPVYEPA